MKNDHDHDHDHSDIERREDERSADERNDDRRNADSKPRFNFRAYERSLDAVRHIGPVIGEIGHHDPDLARQGRRAVTSIPLNLAEGAESSGKLRIARYRNALGSTNEVIAILDVAEALGYVQVDAEQRDSIQFVRATILNLVRTKR